MVSDISNIIKPIRDRIGADTVVQVQRVWLWLGWLAFGVFGVRFIMHFLPPLQTVALFLTVLAFCLPGWVLLSLLWGGEHATRRPELWLWGAILGLLFSTWLCAVEGYVTGMSQGYSVVVFDIVAMTAWFVFTRRSGLDPVRIRSWVFGERALWQVVSLWVLVYFSRAFLPFESLTVDGFTAYPEAMAADLFRQVSHCTSLSLGLPPESLALSGIPAPLGAGIALFPVIGRSWMDPTGPMIGWTIVSHFLIALLFAGIAITALRTFVTRLSGLVIAVFVVFFAGSVYWVYPVLRPDLIVASLAVSPDAAEWTTRFVGPLVHRWILTQPQVVLAVSVGLLTVAWFRSRPSPPAWLHLAALGILAGGMAGVDHDIGWLGIVLGALWIVALWFDYPNDRSRLGIGFLSYLLAVFVLLTPMWVLGIQAPHALSSLTLVAPEGDLISLTAQLLIVFGVLFVLGVGGLLGMRTDQEKFSTYWVWGVLGLALVLITFVRSTEDSILGLRSGAPLLFVLVMIGMARVLSDFFPFTRWRSLILLAALAAAIPTTVTDYYYAGLVSEADHQLLVHPSDEMAAEWAQKYLPPSAVIQSEPRYRDYTSYDSSASAHFSWGASLAQRPMIAGPLALVPSPQRSAAHQRQLEVRAMFGAKQPDTVHARAVRLGVDYLYVGPSEMRRYPRLLTRLSASRDLFDPIFESDSTGIFRVYPISP